MVVRQLASKRGALRLGVVRLIENGRRSDGIVRLVDYAPVYGSIFTAHRTVEIAVALNLDPCFTPVESPESNFTAGPDWRKTTQASVRAGSQSARCSGSCLGGA